MVWDLDSQGMNIAAEDSESNLFALLISIFFNLLISKLLCECPCLLATGLIY